jgi:hypothetical protein
MDDAGQMRPKLMTLDPRIAWPEQFIGFELHGLNSFA